MKNLLLMRHAKSSWANPDLIDFDRGLNDSGNRAAQAMATHLSQEMPLPDMIICSSAQRTRETLAFCLKTYAINYFFDIRFVMLEFHLMF